MAALKTYHQLGGLKEYVYSLTVLKVRNPTSILLGQNQVVGRPMLLLEALGESPLVSLFQLLELHSFALGPFLYLQGQQPSVMLGHIALFFCNQLSLCLPLVMTFVFTFRAHPGNAR